MTLPQKPYSSELEAGRFFGFKLPAVDELAQGQLAERAVRMEVVVIALASLQFFPGIVQRDELVDIEELFAQ